MVDKVVSKDLDAHSPSCVAPTGQGLTGITGVNDVSSLRDDYLWREAHSAQLAASLFICDCVQPVANSLLPLYLR